MYTQRKIFILLVFGAKNRSPDRATVARAKRPATAQSRYPPTQRSSVDVFGKSRGLFPGMETFQRQFLSTQNDPTLPSDRRSRYSPNHRLAIAKNSASGGPFARCLLFWATNIPLKRTKVTNNQTPRNSAAKSRGELRAFLNSVYQTRNYFVQISYDSYVSDFENRRVRV